MMTNINNVNDAKFQAMDLKFILKMEPDKLIIETSSPKDEVQYIGEMPASPLVDFQDIKELLEQKIFKIIIKNEEMLKIKIGATPLEMLPKPKAQANKMKELQGQLCNALQKQLELQKTIDSQKEKIAKLQALVLQLKNTVSEIKSSQNAFQELAQSKFDDLQEQIEQNTAQVKSSEKDVQAQLKLLKGSLQQSISEGNRARKQFEGQSKMQKTSPLDLQEQMKKTNEKVQKPKTAFTTLFGMK